MGLPRFTNYIPTPIIAMMQAGGSGPLLKIVVKLMPMLLITIDIARFAMFYLNHRRS